MTKACPRSPAFVLAVLLMLAEAMAGCGGNDGNEWERLEGFPESTVMLKPRWVDADTTFRWPSEWNAERNELYLDRSLSMQGYFSPDESSLLPDIIGSTERYLKIHSDDAEARVECFGVTDTRGSIDCRSRVDRAFFTGSASRIDLSVSAVVEKLKKGEIGGAALVSDMMGNSDVPGATALLNPLRNHELRSGFQNGTVGVALLGIRLPYWGVNGKCEAAYPLGCWFHEGRKQWEPLADTVYRPLYVLVIGRWREGSGALNIANKLEGVMKELAIDNDSIEINVDHLTESSEELASSIKWDSVSTEDKFTIWHKKVETSFVYRCQKDDAVELKGKVIIADRFSVKNADADSISHVIDCRKIRNECENTGKDTTFINSFEFQAVKGSSGFEEWSSVRELSDRTLDLTEFIAGVHPDFYDATVDPFMKFTCGR